MDRDEAISMLRGRHVEVWNEYRREHPDWIPDLSQADLQAVDFSPNGTFDLSSAILIGAKLPKERLSYPDPNGPNRARLAGVVIDATTDAPWFIGRFGVKYVSKSDIGKRASSQVSVFISYAWPMKMLSWLSINGFGTS